MKILSTLNTFPTPKILENTKIRSSEEKLDLQKKRLDVGIFMFSSLTAPQALSPYQKYLKTPKLDAQIQDLSEDLSLSEGLSLSLSLSNFYDRSSSRNVFW